MSKPKPKPDRKTSSAPQPLPELKLEFTPIKFHQGTGYLLDEISTTILFKKLDQLYAINQEIDFKTPGYKYYKFLKEEDIPTLKNYPHYVGLHYGLNPVWCLWLTQIEGINYSFYINFVTKQMVYSPHRFDELAYQQDILLEGEIMFPNTYLIWDILGHKKQSIYKFNTLTQRIERIRALFNFQYEPDHQIDNLKMQIRQIVPFDQIKALTQTDENQNQHQGLIFLPFNKSTKCYIFRYHRNHLQPVLKTDLNLLEIQQVRNTDEGISNQSTHQFWLSPSTIPDEHDNYLLYEWDGPDSETNLTFFGRAIITTAERSQQIAQIFEMSSHKSESHNGVSPLIEFPCHYIKKFQKWEPLPPQDQELP